MAFKALVGDDAGFGLGGMKLLISGCWEGEGS